MADQTLPGIDEAFGRARLRPRRAIVAPAAEPQTSVQNEREAEAEQEDVVTLLSGPILVELFLAVQFLWGALLFVPGMQPFRAYIRALPYLSSLGLAGFLMLQPTRGTRPKGTGLLIGALLLLAVNLLHPTSQLAAGVAQCIFQLSIAAPIFWAHKLVRSPRQLERLFVLIFLMNFASAGLGVLQVYYPERFMPPQFNSLGIQLNELYVQSLSYLGSGGQIIVRPPGLTDQPGGAALAGGLTALLGLGLSLGARSTFRRFLFVAAAMVGLAAIYLTQVRSVLLMVVGCVGVLGLVAFKQQRRAAATLVSIVGAVAIIVAFLWASSIGGESVDKRFLNIHSDGALRTYQENRGDFLSYTFGELLDKYPFGAGVGRWGMMNTYFGDPTGFGSAPIHSEIQLTGWLLDGGWPMWVLYGGAILASIFAGWKLARERDPAIADVVLLTVTVQVFVTGLSMAGPVFNTQLGVLFWAIGAALHGSVILRTPRCVEAGFAR